MNGEKLAEEYLENLFALEELKWRKHEPWAQTHIKSLAKLLREVYFVGFEFGESK